MREPLIFPVISSDGIGITPAHAGTTQFLIGLINAARDHPRACGNHTPGFHAPVIAPGSPPRMREPLIRLIGILVISGITPAHAGTTP